MTQNNSNYEKNRLDFTRLSEKYFIQRKKGFWGKKSEETRWKVNCSLTGRKKHRIKAEKLKRIDQKFLFVFEQESYLLANEDLQESLISGQFDTPLEHFVLFGYDEVREGKRRIGNTFPFFTEEEYARANPDIVMAVKRGEFASVFGHFILFGYEKFLNGERELSGTYSFEWTESLRGHVQLYFKEEDYLAVNPDVVSAIDRGEFISGWEHFILLGIEEVRRGERMFHPTIPKLSERLYALHNQDIFESEKYGNIRSPYEHFLRYGVQEMIDGDRVIGYEKFLDGERELPGRYPFEWTESLKDHVRSYFKEEDYLAVNPDVVSAIDRGEFISGWEHFILLGSEEVRRGERMFHPTIPKLSERLYALHNQDIFESAKYGNIRSPYEHFLRYGVQEMIDGDRVIIGSGIYRYKEPKLTKTIQKEIKDFAFAPLISIVMPVYNVDAKWLLLAIDSLKRQWYGKWELCIADDASSKMETVDFLTTIDDAHIKIVHLETNVNISAASNAALQLATGEYVALMDHDDELTPDALYAMVKAINESGADFVYSDEDKIEMDGAYCDPHFKPDFSPDMFLSQNYISHLTVIKKSLIERVGGWTVGLEGSQDYDLYLKIFEHTDKIIHIPKVLYHWRKIPGSTAAEFSEKSYAQKVGKLALENAMKRRKIDAEVLDAKYPGTYRVKYTINSSSSTQHPTSGTKFPKVSIVIPFKDKPELLDMCINSVLDNSTYQNYEIIGMSNSSEEAETFEMMKVLEEKDNRVKFYEYNEPFNYSAINNYAVKEYAKGEHIVLLNNDIEIITAGWIEAMLEFSQGEDVGVVGSKLYYPDDTIQHAGVTIGVLKLAGHNFRHYQKNQPGYMGRESVIQNISAVTAACLMIKREIYLDMQGLNEEDLKIAFNDIDLCLRIREAGYLNIYTPYCEAYHYESISRGIEDTPEKRARFNKEVTYMLDKHRNILENGDPYYNPNLTLEREDFIFAL